MFISAVLIVTEHMVMDKMHARARLVVLSVLSYFHLDTFSIPLIGVPVLP
jgi:hypothetical protein